MTDKKDYSNGGFTQKEMLVMLLEGQNELDNRIDALHEKVNTKLSRQELSGWLVGVSALGVLVNTLM